MGAGYRLKVREELRIMDHPDPHLRFLFRSRRQLIEADMATFILWLLLLILCWPLALIALLIYPIVWLVLLPFRLIGISVDGILKLISALIKLPSKVLAKR